jgi:integrase
VVPITEAFEATLVRRRLAVPRDCPWVFPNALLTGPDQHRAWRAAGQRVGRARRQATSGLEAFGIQDAKGHDLRRSCATHLARLGYPPHLIGRLLNHAGALGAVTGIYNRHAYLPELATALEHWHREVLRIASQPGAAPEKPPGRRRAPRSGHAGMVRPPGGAAVLGVA